MALIDCAECGKTVSSKATSCPNCGAPIDMPPSPLSGTMNTLGDGLDAAPTRRTSPIVLIGGVVLLALLLVFVVKPRFFPSAPTPEQIGATVKSLIQQKFDSDPELSRLALKVERVNALREADNRYQGIATIRYDGETHEVPVEIVAGADGIMWKIEPGALLFVAQREWQKSFNRGR